MKLQAVTICVKYADFLECVVANNLHFDRWLMVTSQEDTRTQKLCALHEIECIVSSFLEPDGTGFHARNAKWHVLNEGLDALEQSGWVVVLDADVLLPRHFRKRLEALPLEPSCLYGAEGRKVIKDSKAFEQVRSCEPWITLANRGSQILGYFNLFCLETVPNRYVKRNREDRDSHDDWRFALSFSPERRRILPMTVVHTGHPEVNWRRRVAAEYQVKSRGEPLTSDAAVNGIAQFTDHDQQAHGAAAVIGYFPGGRWREIAKQFAQVLTGL